MEGTTVNRFDLSPEAVEKLMETVMKDVDGLDLHARRLCDALPSIYSQNHDREPLTLRVSDAGSCIRELWANVHDLLDIPWDVKARARMANGTGFGAYLACVLKVGIEAFYPGHRCELEYFFERDTPGHCDLLVIGLDGDFVDAIVEFKWTSYQPKDNKCKPYWRNQSGKYAQYAVAPLHYVVAYIAVSKRDNPFICWRFETAETLFDVSDEYGRRLPIALNDEMPDPDVAEDESFRCSSCRFSGCKRNENPLLDELERTRTQLEESLS